MTYFSPRLPAFRNEDRDVRIVSKANNQKDGFEYAKEKGEVVLRHKKDAATYISAKFYEVGREILGLTIQKFDAESNMPYGSGFTFIGPELAGLIEFLENIRAYPLRTEGAVRISDENLRRISLNAAQAAQLVFDNEDLFAEVVRSAVTKQDVVSVAYRKRQLEVFERLLREKDYFEDIRAKKKCSVEALWQQFFERNPWIFGYGLGYIYLTGLDDRKLEQVVQGFHINQQGKRSDALLKTRGALSNLCFVEIKTHETPLLSGRPYRAGCWAPSSEVTGAVAQVQGTVAYAMDSLQKQLTIRDADGFPTGEDVFNLNPRSFLVVGDLHQFVQDSGVSKEQLQSFELFRQNTSSPEIITFDELFERAIYIVNASES